MTALSEKAVLIRLSTSSWSARKFDKSVSDEVSQTHKAQGRAGRFYKDLIQDEQLQAINRLLTRAREFHESRTLPWLDNGTRILPSTAYLDYIGEMRDYREGLDMLVDEFVTDHYPKAIDKARERLGDLFNPTDYPSAEEVRRKFGLSTRVMPIPDTRDWRVSLREDEMQEVLEDHDRQLREATQQAVESLVGRIRSTVEHVYERLSDPDKRFHNSLIGHVEELVEVLPQLNINDDPNINKICEDLRLKIAPADPTELRKDADARSVTADHAKSILDKVNSIYGPPPSDGGDEPEHKEAA